MSKNNSNTIVDLLAGILSETSTAKMNDDPLAYFAFRGALFDLSKAYELANLVVKKSVDVGQSQTPENHQTAIELQEELKLLADKYLVRKLPANMMNSHETPSVYH